MTTEPRRMLLGGAGAGAEDVAALLASARDDGPSAADRHAVATALGFTTAAVAATAATAATASSSSIAPGAAAVSAGSAGSAGSASVGLPAAAGKLGALALVKLGGALVLALSVGVAVGMRVERVRARSEAAASVSSPTSGTSRSPSQRATAPLAPAQSAESPVSPVSPFSPDDAPVASAAPPALVAPPPTATAQARSAPSVPIAEPAVAPAPAASMLAQETVLLDRARKAVARRAYVDAIAALDAYDVLAPSGVLVQEARALRVQACADQGKRLAALDLGRAFLAEFPSSPYAKRVKAIVDGLDAPSNP